MMVSYLDKLIKKLIKRLIKKVKFLDSDWDVCWEGFHDIDGFGDGYVPKFNYTPDNSIIPKEDVE